MTDQPTIPAYGPRRLPVTLLGIAMALLGLVFEPGDIVRALALCVAAALALTLLLTGRFRQGIGAIVSVLGVGIAIGGWEVFPLAISGIGVTLIGLVIVLVSPYWPQGNRFGRLSEAALDPWRAMDDGLDPTDDAKPVI